MSATIGGLLRRTILFSASPARLSGTATRAISQPTSWRRSIWRIVASTSWVRVAHIDCTETGAPSPIAVPPTQTRFDLRLGRGPTRSSGRFRSTLIVLTEQVSGRKPSRTRDFLRAGAGVALESLSPQSARGTDGEHGAGTEQSDADPIHPPGDRVRRCRDRDPDRNDGAERYA